MNQRIISKNHIDENVVRLVATQVVFITSPKPIFAPPKRFAAGLGLLFSLGIAACLHLHYPAATYAIAGILILCAALEAAFNICLGCYVYNWIVAPIVNKRLNIR